MQGYIIIVSTVFLSSVFCTSFPSNLKQCKRGVLQDCLKDAIQDALPKLAYGIPELNLPAIDPLFIPSVTVGKGTVVDLVQDYKNGNMFGFSKAKIDKVSVTTSTATELNFVVDAIIDRAMLIAEYTAKGVLLGAPFDGDGKCNLTWVNLKIPATFSGKTVEKEGKKYMEFGKVTTSIGTDQLIINLDGISNNDEQKTNALLNEHWNELFMDLKDKYGEMFMLMIQNITNAIFSQIPYDEIIPE